MEHFVVSARKYRPQTFKDVVGQQAITNTLQNAIENNHLAQALLFTGPRGVGKTTCARILAKMINSDGTEQTDEDFAFNIFELDAASNNSVDDIRNLTDQVRIPPQVGNYKVYIIDEVHMLSQAAFNAFLKTLEEPPKHCIFILATTEKHKIIPTILSRCQIFDFKRITVTDAKNYLKYIAEEQGIEAEDDALHIIAQKADGAMRDALSIFDRVVSFSGKKLSRQAVTENLNVLDYDTFFTATDYIAENNIPQLLVFFNEVLSQGFDGHHFISGLASHFRDLLVCQNPATHELLEVGEDSKQKYFTQSKLLSKDFLIKAIEIANDCDLKYKGSKNQRLLVELTLMQLASINFDGEKKNNAPFIIPAEYFKEKGIKPVKVNVPSVNSQIEESNADSNHSNNNIGTDKEFQGASSSSEFDVTINNVSEVETEVVIASNNEDVKPVETPVTLSINLPQKSSSGLSLSSIKRKKEHLIKQMDVVLDPEQLPEDSFTEEAFLKLWKDYATHLDNNGEPIVGAIMSVSKPFIKDKNIIAFEVSNESMRIDLRNAATPLMQHIRKSLNNYKIELEISVNEQLEKQYVFSTHEKFEKLKQKNPDIALLKSTFGLDI
ncbi:DNA polymerase III subunit gamma/tau [Paucihalobacter ruber]|uniref:DNA polymerase III subunit gamma/tau n=1 Tax=Paucihalobacter ruber TaxID=2567861 RepID=A0A506PCG9_9FLAO|nr:DNA polymerase III subunit gamma/tau [Paucihalobacter ruber]